jgi:hypothetical protein
LQFEPAVTGAVLSITRKTLPSVSTLTSFVSPFAAEKVKVAPLTLAVAAEAPAGSASMPSSAASDTAIARKRPVP